MRCGGNSRAAAAACSTETTSSGGSSAPTGHRVTRSSSHAARPLALLAAGGIVVGYWQAGSLEPLFEERRSDVGREAIAWIKRNVPADSTMILRDDFWTDLREP